MGSHFISSLISSNYFLDGRVYDVVLLRHIGITCLCTYIIKLSTGFKHWYSHSQVLLHATLQWEMWGSIATNGTWCHRDWWEEIWPWWTKYDCPARRDTKEGNEARESLGWEDYSRWWRHEGNYINPKVYNTFPLPFSKIKAMETNSLITFCTQNVWGTQEVNKRSKSSSGTPSKPKDDSDGKNIV